MYFVFLDILTSGERNVIKEFQVSSRDEAQNLFKGDQCLEGGG